MKEHRKRRRIKVSRMNEDVAVNDGQYDIHNNRLISHQQTYQQNKMKKINEFKARSFIWSLFIIFCSLIIIISKYGTNCDVLCHKDTSFMHPCSCQNGTTGLLIKCSKTNLAILSGALLRIPNPIEQLEIDNCALSRLTGPLFSDSNTYKLLHDSIRELSIRSSGLYVIQNDTFSVKLAKSINYLQLDRNKFSQIPTIALNQLANLKMLNMSSNLITSIEQNQLTSSLSNLTELDLSWNRINRIAKNAFNSLNSLEYLNLNGNEISKLEKNLFAFGRKIKYLDLSNNKLTTLDRQDFNDLTGLESLLIANNQITSVPRSIFSRNGKLYNLDLSYNQLEDVDTYLFKSVRFLKSLNLAGNKIKELTKNIFSPTTRIKRIDMSHNQIQSLGPETFKGLEWLEKIDLAYNQIVNISNDAFTKIFNVEIDLSHNKLTRIFYWAFHEVANITKLDLSHNLIQDGISLIAFEQTDCAQLDLSYNMIEDISKIPISNFTGIRWLDISHNQITEFNKKSFTQKIPLYELAVIEASYNNISQISGNILERLRSIRFINLSHNSLRRLTSGAFGNSPTLLELDMSHNNLVDVVAGTFVGLVSLKSMDMTHNRLKKMVPIPVALNSIHLEYNDISQISRSAFPSLNSLLELYLDHNRLSQIDEGTFGTLPALHTLSLNYNNLSSIPASALRDLSSLQNLWLEGNSIQRLSRRSFGPTGLPIVFDLNLSHNNISHLSDASFDGLLQLLRLNLSHNQLQELSPEVFKGLVSLRHLDVSHNRLTRLENKTKSAMDDLLSLESANFTSNKLSMITGRTFIASAYIPQRLTKLDLSNNLIGIIVNNFADGMRQLEWLSLRDNIINEIYPNVLSNATRLRYLDLSHNKLRTLRDGALFGRFVNLTSLSLASNKLVSPSKATLNELEALVSLTNLNLSSNRIDELSSNYLRLMKRGVGLDLRHNPLDCSCNMLSFIAWIEAVLSRSTINWKIESPLDNNDTTMVPNGEFSSSNFGGANLWNRPVRKYAKILLLLNETICSRPSSLAMRPITHMLDILNSTSQLVSSKDLICESTIIREAISHSTLHAPIQFNGAESYQDANGNHILKVGWYLADSRLDLIAFVLVRARFLDQIDLSGIRAKQWKLSNKDHQLIDIAIDRIPYNDRTFSYKNMDHEGFQIICLTHVTGDPNYQTDLTIESLNTTSSKLNQGFGNLSQVAVDILDNMIVDGTHYNCIELTSLLRNEGDNSERLISGVELNLIPIPSKLMLVTVCFLWLLVYKLEFRKRK